MLESGIEPSNFDFDNKKRTCFCEPLETIRLDEENGKDVNCGTHENEIDAAKAYNKEHAKKA